MRKSALTLITVGVAAAMTVTGCSSSSKSKSSASPTTAAAGTSASAAATTAASTAAASGKPVVGVVLPDTTTSNRYTLYDQPLLSKAFSDAGVKAVIQNAHGSATTFVSDAQTMITQGVKVLLIDPADPATGISVEKLAKSAGVQVIDYDRVNLGGSAQYYVSFDNEKVGEQQATGLVNCLKATGKTKQTINFLNGGTDIDNNAVLFKAGAHKVLDPLFKNGTYKKGLEVDVKGWDNTVAATDFQQQYTQEPNVGGIVAANDGIASAAISTLKQHKVTIPITGQDATIQGAQYILQGQQCLTIFKNVKTEANAASKLAIALAKGDTATAKSIATGSLKDPKNGRTIPSLLLTATVVTRSNIESVVKAGALTAAQICTGSIKALCTKYKVS
jgi:D-xylose transport system substrate-binding protein